jgi:hypothetical protein
MDWIDLAQDRDQLRDLVNKVMNLRVQEDAGNFLSSWMTGGHSRRAQLQGVSYLLKPVRMIKITYFLTLFHYRKQLVCTAHQPRTGHIHRTSQMTHLIFSHWCHMNHIIYLNLHQDMAYTTTYCFR